MTQSSSSLKSWGFLIAKLVLIALVFWFVNQTFLEGWRQLTDPNRKPIAWNGRWIAFALIPYMGSILVAGAYWRRLLQVLGGSPNWLTSLRAYCIGHLGKYIPGKAMVVVMRAAMVRGPGVDTGVAAASVFLETLTMMAVGSGIALGMILLRKSDNLQLLGGAAALFAITALPNIPAVFKLILKYMGIGRKWPSILEQLERFRLGELGSGWLWMTANWVLQGISLWCVLLGIGVNIPFNLDQLSWTTAAAAISVVAGFVALVPAGAGVRDVFLMQLLSQTGVGKDLAIAASIVMRLVSIAGEVLLAGFFYPFSLGEPQETTSRPVTACTEVDNNLPNSPQRASSVS